MLALSPPEAAGQLSGLDAGLTRCTAMDLDSMNVGALLGLLDLDSMNVGASETGRSWRLTGSCGGGLPAGAGLVGAYRHQPT